VAVGVEDGLGGVALGQGFSTSLAVDVVISATELGEVGGLVDESSGTGVSAGAASLPEDTAEVDGTESKT